MGDDLIIAVANRLEERVGDRGIVARLGGDEFAILLPMLTELEAAEAAATELVNAFSDPLKVGEYDLLAGVSAGVSFSMDNSVDSSTLLRNADLALYKAKTDGRGICRVYEPQMSLQIMLRREMERDLRQALAEDQLVVHYQPLMELERGVEVGFEALLRWNHPQKGMISPADFHSDCGIERHDRAHWKLGARTILQAGRHLAEEPLRRGQYFSRPVQVRQAG